MRRFAMLASGFTLCLLSLGILAGQTRMPGCPNAPQYGNDPNGHFAKVNGISIYYETYGQGPPLLLIHGNGGSIDRDRCQIEYFSRFRRVIIADSRSHGRSDNGPGRLTYEQIADDLSALLKELKVEKVDVWGHSDGGIVTLMLGIHHPSQVGKLVASAANLRPDAVSPEALVRLREELQQVVNMIKAGDKSRDWGRRKQQIEKVLEEPHITLKDLQRIAAPTLVIGGDSDEDIPVSHTVEIFMGIPHAQLFIVPGANHNVIRAEAEFYNSVVARFLDRP